MYGLYSLLDWNQNNVVHIPAAVQQMLLSHHVSSVNTDLKLVSNLLDFFFGLSKPFSFVSGRCNAAN